jgi:hypothetical protein
MKNYASNPSIGRINWLADAKRRVYRSHVKMIKNVTFIKGEGSFAAYSYNEYK